MGIPVPNFRRKTSDFIWVKGGAQQNNLQSIDVAFPLHTMIAVSGVSGSGKTTLVKQIFYPPSKENWAKPPPKHQVYTGESKARLKKSKRLKWSTKVRSASPRASSNPVTYVKAYDAIRDLFTNQQLSVENPGLLKSNIFPSMWTEAVVTPARAKGNKSSKCNSWPMCAWNVKSARANVSKPKCWM